MKGAASRTQQDWNYSVTFVEKENSTRPIKSRNIKETFTVGSRLMKMRDGGVINLY